MAASRTTADYDLISLRTIRAANPLPYPAYTTLVSDGQGGTYWSTLSSPMAYVSAFKTISFSPGSRFVADASFNSFSYMAGTGIQFIPVDTNVSQINANLFAQIGVPGESNLSSGLNAVDFSTFFFSSLGNTIFTTDEQTNTITYEIRHPFFKTSNATLPLNDSVSTVSLIGSNSIILNTSILSGSYTVGVSISSFTSKEFGQFSDNLSTYTSMFASSMASSLTTFPVYSTGLRLTSTATAIAISTFNVSTTNLYKSIQGNISSLSTRTSQTYASVNGGVFGLSTLLSQLMVANTIQSTNSIFSQQFFVTSNLRQKNAISTLNDLSNYTSSQIMSSFLLRITKNNLFSTTLNLQSTLAGTSSYIQTTEGTYTSSFSTQMMTTFSAFLQSTPRYINIYSTPAYTVYSSVQTAYGTNYDLVLSTCEFSLSSFVKYLTPVSRVFIEYSPCYAFTNLYTSNTSTNLYQLSTFITHHGRFVPNAAFPDYMNPLQVYNRASRIEISTGYLAKYNSSTYIFNHLHSSIMYVDSSQVRINSFNPLGGAILPSQYLTDCGLNLTTRAEWMNYTSPTNALSIFIHNATAM